MSRYLALARAAISTDEEQPVSHEINEIDEITVALSPDVTTSAITSSTLDPRNLSGRAATRRPHDLGRAIARTSSTVTGAHLRQDVRDYILQGVDRLFWEAVLRAAGEGLPSAAGRCTQCGEPRLWWTPGCICPVCDSWDRPDGVQWLSLALLLDEPTASDNLDSFDLPL